MNGFKLPIVKIYCMAILVPAYAWMKIYFKAESATCISIKDLAVRKFLSLC